MSREPRPSFAGAFNSMYMQASCAFAGGVGSTLGIPAPHRPRYSIDPALRNHRYQFTPKSKYPKKVTERAWNLLKEYMTGSQWTAFMDNMTIELENVSKSHRLLINKGGNFTMLDGIQGEGINVLSGTIREQTYPLGDEIAAFIDWFRLRTGELINRWGCGSFSIKSNPERAPRAEIAALPNEIRNQLEEARNLIEHEQLDPEIAIVNPDTIIGVSLGGDAVRLADGITVSGRVGIRFHDTEARFSGSPEDIVKMPRFRPRILESLYKRISRISRSAKRR